MRRLGSTSSLEALESHERLAQIAQELGHEGKRRAHRSRVCRNRPLRRTAARFSPRLLAFLEPWREIRRATSRRGARAHQPSAREAGVLRARRHRGFLIWRLLRRADPARAVARAPRVRASVCARSAFSARRGTIYDRDGNVILVRSVPSQSVYATIVRRPRQDEDRAIARAAARIAGAVRREALAGAKRFVRRRSNGRFRARRPARRRGRSTASASFPSRRAFVSCPRDAGVDR
jgi:hypothetical protein